MFRKLNSWLDSLMKMRPGMNFTNQLQLRKIWPKKTNKKWFLKRKEELNVRRL